MGAYGGMAKGELPEPMKDAIGNAKGVLNSGWGLFQKGADKVKSASEATGITQTLKSTGTAVKRQTRELGINSVAVKAHKNITQFG